MRAQTLTAENISFAYSGRPKQAVLREFSVEVKAGEFAALLGPNGCGKSTMLKLMSGILGLSTPGCSGMIRFNEENFLAQPPSYRARQVAYVGYDFKVDFPMSAFEAV